MPSAYQTHALSVSAMQDVESTWVPHASVGAPASNVPMLPPPLLQLHGGHSWPGMHVGQVQELVVGVPSPALPPLETVPEPTQPQLQGGQLSPAAQTGHAQAQVPSSTQPPSVGSAQVQSHGGQLDPGRQEAHAHVQVPPPLPPPEQSHSMGGQVAPAGQYAGLTHAQPLPSGVRMWQKPPVVQVVPAGHSRSTSDHAQAASARHSVRSVCWLQGSAGVHTPPGHVVPSGQERPRPSHAQSCAVSAVQDAESV
jgi:hypothetical protein